MAEFLTFKESVLKQLESFKNYSSLQEDYEDFKSEIDAFYDSLENAINDFYNLRISSSLIDDLAWAMYFEYLARYRTYENDQALGISFDDNFPSGYKDLTSIFNITNSEILNTTPEVVYNSFVFPSSTESEIEQDVTNDLITKWIENLEQEKTQPSQNINNIISFCERNTQINGNISLWENRGQLTRSVETPEIANEVFINRRLKDVINTFGVGGYIPTYYRI